MMMIKMATLTELKEKGRYHYACFQECIDAIYALEENEGDRFWQELENRFGG